MHALGDPSTRVVDVYVPAGHDGRGLPLLVDLVGFTGGDGEVIQRHKRFRLHRPAWRRKDVSVHASALQQAGITGSSEGQRVFVDVAEGRKAPETASIQVA